MQPTHSAVTRARYPFALVNKQHKSDLYYICSVCRPDEWMNGWMDGWTASWLSAINERNFVVVVDWQTDRWQVSCFVMSISPQYVCRLSIQFNSSRIKIFPANTGFIWLPFLRKNKNLHVHPVVFVVVVFDWSCNASNLQSHT